jgi:endonuclease/exonuclease/phosphatase family metal-dependent hydrolase
VPAFALATLNCFGVPTPRTRRRLLTLAQELNREPYSVVCLQEVQLNAYASLLTAACAQYPASASEPFVYAPKGGLLTLARLPIEGRAFELYRTRGIVSPPAVMDWALHKGVLVARLSLAGTPIVVLNTHLSANYSVDWGAHNRYARVEQLQLQQLAEIVREQPSEAVVIAAGDFNIPRGSWLYDEFLAASGMVDPLAGDMRPTQRMPPGVPARFALPIDYALLRSPPLPGLRIQSEHRLAGRLPIAGARADYLSDHVGIELRLEWGDGAQAQNLGVSP